MTEEDITSTAEISEQAQGKAVRLVCDMITWGARRRVQQEMDQVQRLWNSELGPSASANFYMIQTRNTFLNQTTEFVISRLRLPGLLGEYWKHFVVDQFFGLIPKQANPADTLWLGLRNLVTEDLPATVTTRAEWVAEQLKLGKLRD